MRKIHFHAASVIKSLFEIIKYTLGLNYLNPGQKHRGVFATGVTIDNNIAIDFFVNNHRFCDNQALIDTPSITVAHRHVAIHL